MPTVRRAAETYVCAFSTTQQRKKRRNYVLPSQLVKKVPHGTFLTALSAEHFELVQNAIFRKPCYSKVFGGGLFYLRRALPPQTPPLLTYRNVQHSFSTDCAGSNSPPDCCSQLQRPDGRVKLELVSSHSILFAPKNKTTLQGGDLRKH